MSCAQKKIWLLDPIDCQVNPAIYPTELFINLPTQHLTSTRFCERIFSQNFFEKKKSFRGLLWQEMSIKNVEFAYQNVPHSAVSKLGSPLINKRPSEF